MAPVEFKITKLGGGKKWGEGVYAFQIFATEIKNQQNEYLKQSTMKNTFKCPDCCLL